METDAKGNTFQQKEYERINDMKDVAIIGAGPAGLSAALYAARAGLSVQVFDAMGCGGQLTEIAEIENYIGAGRVTGQGLAASCLAEAETAGAEIVTKGIERVEKNGLFFSLFSGKEHYGARSVILANGARPRRLDVPLEQALLGRGVSYCALCDGRFFVGKSVAVVGGGNGAFAEALYLSRIAATVHIVHRSKQFRGERSVLERLEAIPNVVFHTNRTVSAMLGDESVEGLSLKCTDTGKTEILRVSGVFIAIGREPQNTPFASLFSLDAQGYVITDEGCACATDGLFAAGDTRAKALRQISTAVADGANAAESARRYLERRAFAPLGKK
jgi:thioredoxin reductase (NADPH)